MSSLVLKLIVIVLKILDHVFCFFSFGSDVTLFSGITLLTVIRRITAISFSLFGFGVFEGFRKTIVDLYRSGKGATELSREYGTS